MTLRTSAAVLGFAFLSVTGWLHFQVAQGEFYRFSDDPPIEWRPDAISIELYNELAGGFSLHFLGEIKISYSPEMNENQTDCVDLDYKITQILPPPESVNNFTFPKLSATLQSPNFDIAPDDTQVIIPDTNAPLPTTISFGWLISPKAEGDAALRLDLSGLQFGRPSAPTEVTLVVNGERMDATDWPRQILAVKVYTIYGITRVAFDFIRYGIGILGFIIMCPFLAGWLQTKAKAGERL